MLAIFNLLEDKAERNLAEAIYKKHKKAMYGVAYSILKNSADAEDAVMDAVYKIINNISKFDSEASEKTRSLVMIIVRNVALNKYNYNKSHGTVSFDEEAESELYREESPEEYFLSAEAYGELLAKIRALDPIYRDVILMKYLYGYENLEISSMLGISEATVRVRLMRGKKLLKNKLSGGMGNE
jgi:RNA polymerase sigma-70 factor (ECF subfamily)